MTESDNSLLFSTQDLPQDRRFRRFVALLSFVLCLFASSVLVSSGVVAKEIGPNEDLCRVINDPLTENELVLAPGEYQGPCTIRRGGDAERPLIIRAKEETNRPHINYQGESANVLEIRADHVIMKGLAFGPSKVDAIRIRSNKNVQVIDCEFFQIGGIAVVANQSSLDGLIVSGNVVRDSRATAMYFGCHDGNSCRLGSIIIEKNVIDGVSAAFNEIGYGIQVKLNSSAIIRENAVRNTKGPGIMIYGSDQISLKESLIERNFVSGSRTSSAIVIGGGPAIVRNNIALYSVQSGIGLENYGRRGLLRQIIVGFNSVYGNKTGGITAPQTSVSDTFLIGNVGWNDSEAAVFPSDQSGIWQSDNLNCDQRCFANPGDLDFLPVPGSPLDRHRVRFSAAWLPKVDFFGKPRNSPPRAGAVESIGRPWLLP